MKRNQDAGPNVIAVCCSTQGEGTVAVDKAGNASGNAILWMDMHGAPYLHRQLRSLINIDGVDVFKVCTSCGQFKRVYKPQSPHRALYDEKFEIFKLIYRQMKDIHHRMNG